MDDRCQTLTELSWRFRSGLEQDDMRILYKYLTTSLFPRHMEPEVCLHATDPQWTGRAAGRGKPGGRRAPLSRFMLLCDARDS